MYLLQFNSESLHRHITASYKFDNFTKSFVEILAAQQTPEGAPLVPGNGGRGAPEPAVTFSSAPTNTTLS